MLPGVVSLPTDHRSSTGFAYDLGPLIVPVELGPWPHFEYEVLEESADEITYRDYRGITIRNRKDQNTLPDYADNPVLSQDEWHRYRDERLAPRLEERTAGIAAFLRETASLDAPVQVGVFPYGCFGTARDVMGVERLLYTFYDDPELVHEIMESYTDLWLTLYEEVSRHMQIDHIHIWEDMCGKQGSLISMEMVKEFMMPCYDRIAGFADQHGVAAFSVDSDGNVDELADVVAAHGVSSFFPFEVQAGCDALLLGRLHRRF